MTGPLVDRRCLERLERLVLKAVSMATQRTIDTGDGKPLRRAAPLSVTYLQGAGYFQPAPADEPFELPEHTLK